MAEAEGIKITPWTKHGMYGTPTYSSWVAMIGRCTNPNVGHFKAYGGAGITICERWMTFANFFADMGVRPEGTSLDRYPNGEGNYEPGNCRWATPREQSMNRSTSVRFEHNGELLSIEDICKSTGLCDPTIRARIRRGWSIEKIMKTEKVRPFANAR